MDRSLVQPGQLEVEIGAARIGRVIRGGAAVAGLEDFDDPSTPVGILHLQHAPGAGVSDRGCAVHSGTQPVEEVRVDGVEPEMPDVPPPPQQIVERFLVRGLHPHVDDLALADAADSAA